MRTKFLLFSFITGVFLFIGCNNEPPLEPIDPNAPMLSLIPSKESKVFFSNDIVETKTFNHYVWEEIYNGGGVSAGDINGDGLPDLFFSGNKVNDKLYLNKGNFKFEDITKSAKIKEDGQWSFGTTMADVNGDGLLDIYVCRGGPSLEVSDRRNLLYINNGDNTFSERAKAYGLDHGGVSMQATFFDYDKDGDLDMYLVNQPLNKRYLRRKNINVNKKDPIYSDHLYRNDGEKFVDVTKAAGLINYSYGLNAVASDLDDDGWVDIFVSNDYEAPDMLLINNHDGTFTDKNKEQFKHVSFYGMGSDVADYDNDGLKDIGVVDMASADHYRSKTNMGSMDIAQFWSYVNSGKHYQYMYNTLQKNNGNGTFSEVAQVAHISKTDWSWTFLFGDLDNDSYKDIIITNGILRDIRNNDVGEFLKKQIMAGNKNFDVMKLIQAIPSTPMSNYVFQNNGDLTFKNASKDWGFDQRGFSNGMAYADLDKDGDLDLIINNMNAPASIYKNNKGRLNNYLQVKLEGSGKNPFAMNTQVKIEIGDKVQLQELTTTRGYFSSSEPLLHFGLGDAAVIDKLTVFWPTGKTSTLTNVNSNQRLVLKEADADGNVPKKVKPNQLFVEMDGDFQHKENEFDDFKREILIPHKESQNGPYIATGDVNNDGNEDYFIGGAAGQAGRLYLNNGNGFDESPSQPWNADAGQEDMGALLFDADGDKDLDLYIVSGGAAFPIGSPKYQDRLYLNDGKGNFRKQAGALPKMHDSGQRVVAGDFDKDGDLDLFVGGRIVPGKYPKAANSHLLLNNNGRFKDVTNTNAPGLAQIGLVTDAVFADYDKDGDDDLIVVGEWMPLSIFKNTKGKFENVSKESYTADSKGFWWSVAVADFDKDGDMDIVAGNLGMNIKFKGSKKHPFVVLENDFDGNGTNDVVLAKYSGNKLLPMRGRQCTSEQMPFVAKKFPTFDGFAKATIPNILPDDKLKTALRNEVTTFNSTFFKNNGAGQFTANPLPVEAQFAPMRGIEVLDINNDGNLDIMAVGNLYQAEVETIRYDAGTGWCLFGDGKGNFKMMPVLQSGFKADRDARDIAIIHKPSPLFIVANNNDKVQIFKKK